MKKRLCILAAAFCLAATPVFAQENSGDTIEATAATAEEMSDDIYSFQVKIDGELYQFPMKYEEFAAKGWNLDGISSEEQLSPNSYGLVSMKYGRISASVTFMNFGINTKPLSECYVAGIDLSLIHI